MNIRKYQKSDFAQINQLFYDTVHTVNAKDYSPEHLEAWAPKDRDESYWEKRLEEHSCYVAEIDGVIAGFGDMTKEGCIDHLYVHKDFQGKKVGSIIFEQLEQEAKKLSLHELTTEASITAKPFFEAKGFCVVAQQEKKHKGMIFVTFSMCKKI